MNKWRAQPFKKSSYYLVTSELYVTKTTDKNRDIDIRRWKLGNYFETIELAKDAAQKIKAALKYPEKTP